MTTPLTDPVVLLLLERIAAAIEGLAYEQKTTSMIALADKTLTNNIMVAQQRLDIASDEPILPDPPLTEATTTAVTK